MKCIASLLSLAFLCCASAADVQAKQTSTVTPIQKVLQLMQKMLAEGIAAKKEEEVKYAAFSQWCQDQTRVKENEITQGTNSIESLTASIEKSTSTIRALGERIAELDEDVGRWAKDKTAASGVRQREKADFVATVNDYTESLEAITQAIRVLKKQSYDRPQAELLQALVQVRDLPRIPLKTKGALMAFLQQGQPGEEYLLRENPEAHGYEFQSTGVVEMLERLKDEFSKKKTELEKEELTAQHAFDQMMQQLTDNTENADHELARKRTMQGEEGQLKAETEGNLAQVTKDRAEDQSYLSDLKALCSQKKTDFESRQTLRAEEIESLGKAIEIISAKTVKGSGEEYLPQLMQIRAKRGAGALAQLRALGQSPQQERVVTMLQDKARDLGSTLLSQVAAQVANDPFGKVKKLIKDLISKLMQEATGEAEHKGWCDTELATNKINRETRTAEVETLQEHIEELTAKIVQLTQDIERLSSEVAELDAAMAASTAERQDSKAKNEKTIADAKEAQIAVGEAITILKEYYAKSVEATSLVQQTQTPIEDAPETFDKPYKGMFPEGGTIIDFLEVILTDFSRLESQTSADEAQEQDEYEKFMFESKKDKALKENEKGHKESTKTDKESDLHQAQEDLKMSQAQLDKAIEYYDKLKPSCVDSGITYEERVRRREEEIQSLEEALRILSGEDV